jgi:hypothetical protein
VKLDDVRAVVAEVLADLGHPDVHVEVGPDDDGLVTFTHPDGGLVSTRLEPDSREAVLVQVADRFQVDANFWLPDAWGEPLPTCPGHPHPADPRLVEDVAWWVCPATGEPIARIGALHP